MVERLFAQIKRVVEINELHTPDHRGHQRRTGSVSHQPSPASHLLRQNSVKIYDKIRPRLQPVQQRDSLKNFG
jgi:hypothetical protein